MSARRSIAHARIAELRGTVLEPWMRAALLFLGAVLLAVVAGLRLNVTPSYPLGFYRVEGDGADVVRGSIVTVCLQEEWARFGLSRGYLGSGWCPGGSYPLGKMVLATGGDIVETTPAGITVNGRAVHRSRTLPRDAHGRALPHFPFGRHCLRDGDLWLYSPYTAAAYDSRYFGPVGVDRVQAVVRPVWTWR
ncbi:MAG TPA: conjugative transfer signal peptidase TraF [Longimicrobium sp.]